MIEAKLLLNNGRKIPQLGLGVWRIPAGRKCEEAVLTAFEAGYRHIDTASFYGNEESAAAPPQLAGPRTDAAQQGKARSIGVSNFTIRHLTELLAQTGTVPAVNQVEFHPYLYQRELLKFCAARGIVLSAYSPLTQGERLSDRKLVAIAKKYLKASPSRAGHGTKRPSLSDAVRGDQTKSTAQILIRWAIQHDLIVIPKSANASRIRENAEVFDFEITDEDMETLDGFNENLRTCWDPTNAR